MTMKRVYFRDLVQIILQLDSYIAVPRLHVFLRETSTADN
jgi:hypothetical protein